MTPSQAAALRAVARMFLDAVKEGGKVGAPGGVMYAAVMDKLSLSQFQQIMDGLVAKGCLRRDGELYFYVKDL
jgi:hypothetical protein